MNTALSSQYIPSFNKQSEVLSPYSNREAIGPLLDTVFKMRYESYSGKQFIETNNSKLFLDEYDGKSNCTSYLTFRKQRAIGSIRGCMYDPSKDLPIPIADVFHNEIQEALGFDKPMMEINKFVIAPHFQRRGGVTARFMIYDNVVSAAIDQNAEYLVAGVREEHIDYNRAMFGFELASDLRSYPHLQFKTALMICPDIASVKQKIDRKLNKRKPINDSSLSYGVC